MAFEQRNNSGALFKNDRKEKETHPDYQGDCTVGGTKYRMSAWLKDGKKGKFMSFSFTPATSRPEPSSSQQMDDDLPF